MKIQISLSRIKGEVSLSRIKGEDEYAWFKYCSAKPYTLSFRGKPVQVEKGDIFGTRPSSNGKQVRLVLKKLGNTKVFTLTSTELMDLGKAGKPA
jgi:hypothetical protein